MSYNKLKFDPFIFDSLLNKDKTTKLLSNNVGGIILGNPKATNHLIKVCNPFCGPCSTSHSIIEDLLLKNKNLKVQIIFMVTNELSKKVAKHLLVFAEENDIELVVKALHNWYKMPEKNYEKFASEYKINQNLEIKENQIKTMYDWCKGLEINVTPTYFINGSPLPDIYGLDDLEYLVR